MSLRFGFSEEGLARLIWWNTSINKSMYQLGEIHVICIFCWELGKINPVTKEGAQVNLMGVKPKADSLRTLNFRWRKNIWEVKYSYIKIVSSEQSGFQFNVKVGIISTIFLQDAMQVFPTDAQHSRKLISGFHNCKFNSILTEIDSVFLFDLKPYN